MAAPEATAKYANREGGNAGCFPFGDSVFAWFVSFAVQFERTHVRCYDFKYLKSVNGGISAWSEEIDSKVPRY
jgi:hypothetical protein